MERFQISLGGPEVQWDFFQMQTNTKNHKMSRNCIYISFTFTPSVAIKLVSKTQRLIPKRATAARKKLLFPIILYFSAVITGFFGEYCNRIRPWTQEALFLAASRRQLMNPGYI